MCEGNSTECNSHSPHPRYTWFEFLLIYREGREVKQGGWMQAHSQFQLSLCFAFFAPFALNNS
jgi:hypothetical protein